MIMKFDYNSSFCEDGGSLKTYLKVDTLFSQNVKHQNLDTSLNIWHYLLLFSLTIILMIKLKYETFIIIMQHDIEGHAISSWNLYNVQYMTYRLVSFIKINLVQLKLIQPLLRRTTVHGQQFQLQNALGKRETRNLSIQHWKCLGVALPVNAPIS